GRQFDRPGGAQAAGMVEGRGSASVGADVWHDAARVHDARGCQPRRNQGGIQGWGARSDGAEAAREQAFQDQSRVRKLISMLQGAGGRTPAPWSLPSKPLRTE